MPHLPFGESLSPPTYGPAGMLAERRYGKANAETKVHQPPALAILSSAGARKDDDAAPEVITEGGRKRYVMEEAKGLWEEGGG